MNGSIFPTLILAALAGFPQAAPNSTAQQSTSQPTTSPESGRRTTRESRQLEILRKLIPAQDSRRVILPKQPQARTVRGGGQAGETTNGGVPLLLEGISLVERPGRLVRTGDRAEFVFDNAGAAGQLRRMIINKSEQLEMMERLAESGVSGFTISAEITTYRDRNYLNLRRVRARRGHGNLAP